MNKLLLGQTKVFLSSLPGSYLIGIWFWFDVFIQGVAVTIPGVLGHSVSCVVRWSVCAGIGTGILVCGSPTFPVISPICSISTLQACTSLCFEG